MDTFPTSHPYPRVYNPRPQIIGRALVHPQPLPISQLVHNPQVVMRKRRLNPRKEGEEYIPNVPESFYIPTRSSVPIYRARKPGHFIDPTPQSATNYGQPEVPPVIHYYRPKYYQGQGYLIDCPPPPPPLPVELWENDTEEFVYNDEEKQTANKRFHWNNELMQKIFDDTKLNCEPVLVSMERVDSLKRQSTLLEAALEKEVEALESTKENCALSIQSFKESSAKFHSEMERLSKPVSEQEYNEMVDKFYTELKEKLARNSHGKLEQCGCDAEMRQLVENEARKRSGISKEAFEHLYKDDDKPEAQMNIAQCSGYTHVHPQQQRAGNPHLDGGFTKQQLERASRIKGFLRRVFTTKFNTWKNWMSIQGITHETIYEKEQQHLKRLQIMDNMDPIQIERFNERFGRQNRDQRQVRRVANAGVPTEPISMGFDLPPDISTGTPLRHANSTLFSGGGLVEVKEPAPVSPAPPSPTPVIQTERLPAFHEIWAPANANQVQEDANASYMQGQYDFGDI